MKLPSVAVVAIVLLTLAVGGLAADVYELHRTVEAISTPGAAEDYEATMAAAGTLPPAADAALEARVSDLEAREPVDLEARRLAEAAQRDADNAASRADEAYDKALEPCLIHRLC